MSDIHMQYVSKEEIHKLNTRIRLERLNSNMLEHRSSFEEARKTVLRNVTNIYPHQGITSILKSVASLGCKAREYQEACDSYFKFMTENKEILK